jgi:2,5-diamino-6-(ribosylamino)-4(3H)-pyrimidinone 5'-phosphate reductase
MLPYVYINVATSADGKLAPANRNFVAFGSQRDQNLLLRLRAAADAVMAGARTVDLVPVNLGPGPARYRRLRIKNGLKEYNLRVVVSGSATLSSEAEIFKRRFSPIIVLACAKASEKNLRRLGSLADEVKVVGEKEVDFRAALIWLRSKWKVKRLLSEGGGEVNAGLFRAGLVDEVYQTICPLIFGGRSAPTMADGLGAEDLARSTRLQLKSLKRIGQELFLVFRARKKAWV